MIGAVGGEAKAVTAKTFNVNASDSISTKNANITINDGITLASGTVSLDGTKLVTNGAVSLLAGNFSGADWTAGDGNTLVLNNTGVSATGDVAFKAGKITVTADANNDPVKEISGKNLLLAAASSYDAATKKYTMGSGQTVGVTNTKLNGSDSLTLIGYNVNVKGDVTTERLLGAVGKEVTVKADGSDVKSFVSPETGEPASKLTIEGIVKATDENKLIYIGLYGDAEFINKNPSGTQTMSFSANSPYSLDISGDMTVTDPGGIRLSSKSIRIGDNLTASHEEASIVLGSRGGEMNIAGDLKAGKDVIIRSTENIVVGKEDGSNISITAENGKVNLLAGNFEDINDISSAWTGGTGAAGEELNNNISITNVAITAKGDVDIKGGSVAFSGANNTIGSTDGHATVAAANGLANGVYTTGANNNVTISGTEMDGTTNIIGSLVTFQNDNKISGIVPCIFNIAGLCYLIQAVISIRCLLAVLRHGKAVRVCIIGVFRYGYLCDGSHSLFCKPVKLVVRILNCPARLFNG